MKGLIKIGLTALLGMLLMSACSSKEEDMGVASEQMNITYVTAEQMGNAIMAAGEEAGWKMTEFKNNEVLAEKFGDDPVSASITFDKTGFKIDSDHENGAVDDLKEAIKDRLSSMAEH